MQRTATAATAAVLVMVVLMGPASTRGLAQSAEPPKGTEGAGQEAGQRAAPPPASLATTLDRWMDLQTATLLARYRFIETDTGVTTSDELQDSVNLKGRFKFDSRGYYTVNAALGTGGAFVSGWNSIGVGSPRVTDVALKQLFAAGTPINGIQLSVGGFTFERGESSEITTYDNDGYLMGERLVLKRPELFFNEIALTNGYLGDTTTTDVFARFHRLWEPNYRQVLVTKTLTSWLDVSADYTHVQHTGTLRAAVSASTKRARLIDQVQWEQYRRGGSNAAYGFAAFVEKTFARRLIVRAGYADIDPNFGPWNADKFRTGRRWYGQADYLLTRDLTAWVFVSHAAHNDFKVGNATRVDAVLTFNAIGPLRRAGLLR